MFEYINAYLNSFKWAKQAYQYTLDQSQDKVLNISIDDLVSSNIPSLETDVSISTAADWNKISNSQYSTLGGLYKSVDDAEGYLNSLYSLLFSRLAESNKRTQELGSQLKVIQAESKQASTSLYIKGGDTSWIETASKYYREDAPLEKITDESIFRLKDTGSFSSIRSPQGFAGTASIDKSLGKIIEEGYLSSIVDGSRNSFWSATMYSQAPIRADQNDISWLPSTYKHGFAFILTYNIDRPTLISEIYIDPVSSEPFDIVAVNWTPYGTDNTLVSSTFNSSSTNYWRLNNHAMISTGYGINQAYGLCAYEASGFASYTFPLSGAGTITASGGTYIGTRAELSYNMMGIGDLYSGARLVWLDSGGNVIDYTLRQDFPSGFFTGYNLMDIVPPLAASGRLDLGIFTATVLGSAFFDSISLTIGEKSWSCGIKIDKPTTIPLQQSILSKRISFVLAQRNPKREVLSRESATSTIVPITGSDYIDTTLQDATQLLSDALINKGSGNSVFSYRIGIKELDLRYREYVPRGCLVSLPLQTSREIRKIWVTSELGKHYNSGVTFNIYPFAEDEQVKQEILPFSYASPDSSELTYASDGEVLDIFTTEEDNAGWSLTSTTPYIIDPKPIREVFDGTDRDSKIPLTNAPHIRRVRVNSIEDWLEENSILPASYDPNSSTLYGTSSSADKDTIRSTDFLSSLTGTATGIDINSFTSTNGYQPIKVTIRTDNWTAYPDTVGRPDTSKVRSSFGEILTTTTSTKNSTSSNTQTVSYDAWLSSLTFGSLKSQSALLSYGSFWPKKKDTDSVKAYVDLKNSVKNLFGAVSSFEKKLKKLYSLLSSNGMLPTTSSDTESITYSIKNNEAFQTKYHPIITGPNGSLIKLFWFNSTSGYYVPINSNQYHVDAAYGIITVLSISPSGYDNIVADYKYVSDSPVEDFFGSVLSFYSTPATGTESFYEVTRLQSRSLPITRNMTDYLEGKTPILQPPDLDRMSKSYYPVIEYYLTADGQAIFSRDFFRYGDVPATVEIEYETLGVAPRVALNVTREGPPSISPSIYSIGLKVREGSSSPMREVQ